MHDPATCLSSPCECRPTRKRAASPEVTFRAYAVRVALVRESRTKYEPGPSMTCASDIARHCAPLADLDREHFVVLHVDAKSKLISQETVSIGHLTAALVHPREVFKGAYLANANAIAFAHNHPSGDTEPSREDIELTRRLVRAGEMLGIPVLDHVIIGRRGAFTSIAERGLL